MNTRRFSNINYLRRLTSAKFNWNTFLNYLKNRVIPLMKYKINWNYLNIPIHEELFFLPRNNLEVYTCQKRIHPGINRAIRSQLQDCSFLEGPEVFHSASVLRSGQRAEFRPRWAGISLTRALIVPINIIHIAEEFNEPARDMSSRSRCTCCIKIWTRSLGPLSVRTIVDRSRN